jgi:hypothetical protein
MSLSLVDLMDSADILMIQGGGGFSLTEEAFLFFLAFPDVGGKELQSHEAVEFGVFGFVNDTHATFSKLLKDFVVADGRSNHPNLRGLLPPENGGLPDRTRYGRVSVVRAGILKMATTR